MASGRALEWSRGVRLSAGWEAGRGSLRVDSPPQNEGEKAGNGREIAHETYQLDSVSDMCAELAKEKLNSPLNTSSSPSCSISVLSRVAIAACVVLWLGTRLSLL